MINRNRIALGILSLAVLGLGSCSSAPKNNPYESSSPEARAKFKKVPLPLPPGTRFRISQGAFGQYTHHDRGHEYTWDFDVPFGTPVLAVDDGIVIDTWAPPGGGGCDPKFNNTPHTLKIRSDSDGTVAQYVHIDASVGLGQKVHRGDVVGVTAENGFICTPQLDFGIYLDDRHLYGSGQMQSIPLLFNGLPQGGIAFEGYQGVVPKL